MPRIDPVTINRAEKETLSKVAQRVKQLPRGRWGGASTYRPGTTSALIGQLTSALPYSTGHATFLPWASAAPDNEAAGENALVDEDELTVFNWAFLQTGEQLDSGSRVTVIWAAGRWYVVDGPCPTAEA